MMLMTRHHRALLIRLQIGGCTCMTKTNEVKYHASDCQYRLASEIEDALKFVDDTPELLSASKPTASAVVLDDECAAFEAWMKRLGSSDANLERWAGNEDQYSSRVAQAAWEGWQARAASPQAKKS